MKRATTVRPVAIDVRKYFESRLRRHGDSPKSLDWSREGQLRRFEVLTQVGEMSNRDVLDVGCGLGHLSDFLESRFSGVHYTGIDMSPRMIDAARRRRPDAQFLVVDGTSRVLPVQADFVIASGVLNLETGNNPSEMRRLIRSCFSACRVAVAVNMLSTWADWFDKGRHYYDPMSLLRFARTLSKRVSLRHDYLPHDFTLFIYR